ncbi:MAG TPA: Tad domain-containing protein [Chloroflexota bacterium]|nr:Tad domain-containing protein [Chloroflexota bacterium]
MIKKLVRRSLAGRQPAQTLILFTLLFTVVIGFLALAIDLGFLFGQRRFNQDGADAATLGVARTIAGSISPDPNNHPYISTTDCTLYKTARQYAGLSIITTNTCPNNLSATPPAGTTNQNPALDSSNKVAVILEYFTGASGASWCYSPASLNALPTGTFTGSFPRSGEAACTLVTGQDGNFPPSPGYGEEATAYKVRVTVTSVTSSSFAQVLIPNGNIGSDAQQGDQTKAACFRPALPNGTRANGMLTCAQAVASIAGVPGDLPGAILPFVSHDCNLSGGSSDGKLYELWTNNSPPACPDGSENLGGSWKAYVDLSWEQAWSLHNSLYRGWCPVYYPQFLNGMPTTSVPSGTYQQGYQPYYTPDPTHPAPPGTGWPSTCITTSPGVPSNPSSSVHDWQRGGPNGYTPDPNYPGQDSTVPDIQYWASQGFGGTLRPDTAFTLADGTVVPGGHGNFVPTYSCGGCGGDLGSNVATSLYCKSGSVTGSGDGCNIGGNNQTTYFFAWSHITSNCPLPGNTPAPSTIRCRLAGIPTWSTPQVFNGGSWHSGGNPPDRIKLVQIVPMRLYCEIGGGDTYCNSPPNDLPSVYLPNGGIGSSSTVGMFVSNVAICVSNCGGKVSFMNNAATLSQ